MLFSGHHRDNHRRSDDPQLNMSLLWEGRQRTLRCLTSFWQSYTLTSHYFSDLWLTQSRVVNHCVNYNLTIFALSFASYFKLPSMSPALAPGIHLTIFLGFGFTYRKNESAITRFGFLVVVSPSGEKRLATWSGRWWTTGLCFELRFLRTATQPPWQRLNWVGPHRLMAAG